MNGEISTTFANSDEGVPPLDNNQNDPNTDQRSDCCRCWKLDGNSNAQSILIDQIATSPLLLAFYFISAAIISVAEERVGCGDLDDDEECTGKIWGVKPSSLITLINGVVGVISVVSLPIIGAIVDYTPYRKRVGYWTAAALIILELLMICLRRETLEMVIIIYMVRHF